MLRMYADTTNPENVSVSINCSSECNRRKQHDKDIQGSHVKASARMPFACEQSRAHIRIGRQKSTVGYALPIVDKQPI